MNVTVANYIDPTPDRIAARLAGRELRTWIVDEQCMEDRNAVIICVPEKQLGPRGQRLIACCTTAMSGGRFAGDACGAAISLVDSAKVAVCS